MTGKYAYLTESGFELRTYQGTDNRGARIVFVDRVRSPEAAHDISPP